MFEVFLQYLSVAALSSLKVLPGLALAMVYKFNGLEIFVTVGTGGIAGTTVFTFLGERIRKWLKKRRKARSKGKKRSFNIRKARRILRIWHKFGLLGIAVLTPPIFSPALGSIIAVAFRESRKRILLFMYISVLSWAALFALVGDKILDLLGKT